MGSKPVDPVLVEAMRQEFLAGATLRQLAARHPIGIRTLAKASSSGGWVAQRGNATKCNSVPQLIRAADRRAETVARSWQDRLGGIIETATRIINREMELLDQADTSDVLVGDRTALLRMMASTLKDLRGVMPEMPKEGVAVDPATVAAARERLEKRFEAALAERCARCKGGAA